MRQIFQLVPYLLGPQQALLVPELSGDVERLRHQEEDPILLGARMIRADGGHTCFDIELLRPQGDQRQDRLIGPIRNVFGGRDVVFDVKIRRALIHNLARRGVEEGPDPLAA